jgi:Polyketide cyclase / dehydrase and lipid transport
MPSAKIVHVFALPARELWALIGDFGDTSRWSGRPAGACVQEGRGIGSLRTLTLDDGRQIVDRLEAEGENFYSYSIVRSPLPVSSYKATMAVAPVDASSSQLTWSGEFVPVGMSDADAIKFWENIYRMGIGLMERTIARRG